MHYYKHHIGDFLAATAMMTKHEAMTYLQMIWRYYDTEQPLPDDPEKIARRVQSDVATVDYLLDEKFYLHDGCWHHQRCDDEIAAMQNTSAKRRRAAEQRWHSQGDANAMQVHTNSNADAMQKECYPLPTTHNPQPTTQEGNENKRGEGQTAKRFIPPSVDEVRQEIQRLGYNIDAETFVAHYETNGWMVGKNKMKNWKSALVTWQKREAKTDAPKARKKL